MDKFKVGDKVYWLEASHDPEEVAIGTVVDYNPEGFGLLDWVKYKVVFKPNGRVWWLGNDASPDVFGSKVLSKKEYEFMLAKDEYEQITDHGNGD